MNKVLLSVKQDRHGIHRTYAHGQLDLFGIEISHISVLSTATNSWCEDIDDPYLGVVTVPTCSYEQIRQPDLIDYVIAYWKVVFG